MMCKKQPASVWNVLPTAYEWEGPGRQAGRDEDPKGPKVEN